MTSDEMNFFRTGGYTFFEHKRNEEILEKFKLEPVHGKPKKYIGNRMPKKILNYRPNGQRLWKTYEDSDEDKLGLSKPNSLEMMTTMMMMMIIHIMNHMFDII